jgi:hypothetical protein
MSDSIALARVTPVPRSRNANSWMVPRIFGRAMLTGTDWC